MRKALLVLAGGCCGTLARYFLAAPLLALARLGLPDAIAFPYDVLVVNLAGALAIGLLYGLYDRTAAVSADVRLALGTGFLGAFTTFGTMVYGDDQLLRGGEPAAAVLYLCGGLLLGVALAQAGYRGAGLLAGPAASVARLGGRRRRAQRAAWLAAEWRESDSTEPDELRWAGDGADAAVGDERLASTSVPGQVRS